MTTEEKKQLEITACKVRMGVIEGTHSAKAGSRRQPVRGGLFHLSVF